MSEDKQIKTILSWVLLVAFVAAVEWFWGWSELLKLWQNLSWQSLAVAAILFLTSYLVRTWRLYDYFPSQLGGRLITALRLMLIHNILNVLLPARTGEVSFPLLMKRYFGVEYSRSLPALLWFRILDLHTVLFFGVLAFLAQYLSLPMVIIASLAWASIPLLLYHSRHYATANLGREGKWRPFAHKVLDGFPSSPVAFWKCWGLTLLNWGVKIAVLAWLLGQFVDASAWYRMMSAIGGELTSVLPFHAPGGVGTYEAGMMAVLTPVVTLDEAGQGAINTHLFVIGASAIGGIIGLLLPAGKPRQQEAAVE